MGQDVESEVIMAMEIGMVVRIGVDHHQDEIEIDEITPGEIIGTIETATTARETGIETMAEKGAHAVTLERGRTANVTEVATATEITTETVTLATTPLERAMRVAEIASDLDRETGRAAQVLVTKAQREPDRPPRKGAL